MSHHVDSNNDRITVVVTKGEGAAVGITLGLTDDGQLLITAIREDALIRGTELRINMQILQINGASVEGMTATNASDLIRDTDGPLTIVAAPPTATAMNSMPEGTVLRTIVNKPTPDAKVGIGMGTCQQGIAISSIKEGSPASLHPNTLQAGMVIRSVNGVDCRTCQTQTAKQIARLFAESPLTVTIETEIVVRGPPGGLKEGGQWVDQAYMGPATWVYCLLGSLCLCIPSVLVACCCPQDLRRVYILEGRVYTEKGTCLGWADDVSRKSIWKVQR